MKTSGIYCLVTYKAHLKLLYGDKTDFTYIQRRFY